MTDWNIPVTRASFLVPEIRDRSQYNYEQIVKESTRHQYIPFDDAWRIVTELVDRLAIPQE